MRAKKICWVAICCVSLLFLNYAFLYERNMGHLTKLVTFTSTVHDVITENDTLSTAGLAITVTSKNEPITTSLLQSNDLQPCDLGGLKGRLRIDFTAFEEEYWNELDGNQTINKTESYLGNFSTVNVSNFEAVFLGRLDCRPIQRIAIIVPFRDRQSHLKILLGHLLPILKRQGVRYSFFVVEQTGRGVFNKGRVMNTGFKYAAAAGQQNSAPFDCFVFQDVDLLMEDDKLQYKCSGGKFVDHLSTTINKFDYKPLCCGMTVGGVLAFSGEQYRQVNGFPNNFWGWGGEDDAMNQRVTSKGLRIKRPNYQVGRYTMIKHEREKLNPYNNESAAAMKAAQDSIDMNGLLDLNTTIIKVEKYKFFTRVYVDVGKLR